MFDVRETSDAFILQADMPGVVEKDIDISLANNRLTISGKRESEQEVKGETYYRSERTWGNFSRSFTLPTDVDANKVGAELKNGVLVISLPKTGESTTRHIPVHAEKK
jgi:HSP20 family protein